jgi:hypothetical protein
VELGPGGPERQGTQGAGIPVGCGSKVELVLIGAKGKGSPQGGDLAGPEGQESWWGGEEAVLLRAGVRRELRGWRSQWGVDPTQSWSPADLVIFEVGSALPFFPDWVKSQSF